MVAMRALVDSRGEEGVNVVGLGGKDCLVIMVERSCFWRWFGVDESDGGLICGWC